MAVRDPAVDFSLFGGAEVLPPSLRNRNHTRSDSPQSISTDTPTLSSDDEAETPEITPGVEPLDGESTFKLPGEQWAPRAVDPPQNRSDFLWMMTEEPHRTRRMAIMKAHPEASSPFPLPLERHRPRGPNADPKNAIKQVTKLMGCEPLTKWVVLLVTLIQFSTAYYLRSTPFFSLKFWALAYVIGGTANQNTFLAVHEITHNLAFRGVKSNRLFAIFANLPIGVPFAMMFKKYHIEHHKVNSSTFQIFFYALRPGFIRYQAPTRWIALNMITQFSFDVLVVKTLGWSSLLYFLLSSHMAGSLHPCAGHFIAEHYLFDGHDQETWSYYGPLNILAYNVGYHNEHHDFPSVPWTRLPKLRELAKEFYDPLPSHPSWPGVTWRFIFDPAVGMWSRAKRNTKKTNPRGDEGGGGVGAYAHAGGLKDE
ncbi:SPOSA6832_02594 [Sporobolomyces salmonicolor]|uniref:SPOSA6832_02594-mRNA-1:cds n=1 Tax=Sporidiobolus salmonicolor TaxID=5005 RepID=A0A0D6ELY1_SPOSA|nr:SPOSA6832_02594 [Sporobolomyces salmonicolor]